MNESIYFNNHNQNENRTINSTSSLPLNDNDSKLIENALTTAPNTTIQTNPINDVDFSNLNNINTSTSQLSNISASTTKSKGLSKLFSRKRSLTNIADKPFSGANYIDVDSLSSDRAIDSSTTTQRKHSSLRLIKKKQQSTTETILKPETSDKSPSLSGSVKSRKNSINSPVTSISNLFHKSSSSNKLDGKNIDDQLYSGQSRTGLCLSSNNSNSTITNPQSAKLFKFTNPNYTNDEYDGITDHKSFLDIHKKMSTPADSYIQNKLNKHNQPELGLGIVTDSDNKITDKEVDRAHRQFMLLFKHIFTPSTQGLFDYGLQYPSTGFSLEEFGLVIRDHFKNLTTGKELVKEMNPKSIKSKSKNNKLSVKHHKQNQQMKEQNEIEEENFTILKTEEVIYELSSMLNQGMQYLKSDMSKLIKLEILNKNKKQIVSETEELQHEWNLLSKSWIYYNTKIRFQLLQILTPLEFYLNNHNEEDTFQSDSNLPKFDEFLLQSFYITFIGPFLNKRDYKLLNLENTGPNFKLLNENELKYMIKNPKIICTIIECFGAIQSIQYSSLIKPENENLNHLHILNLMISELSNINVQ
ncbi:hypothetical protein KGF54_005182 [Candida jiufengensis]|uniref:uncharacterized protein n=1 Tax=Candida jiufengensis TaxID=497108 RepID=UPI00222481FE|nr:uncharacterized protein KGF54_005182 [Candida jiufengensis]KAI5950365.1 hypothetical protein KGF54_005182 [Candida jiufengensis]